jgi:hypothetical protein
MPYFIASAENADETWDRICKARAAIIKHVGDRKRRDVEDSLPCPICEAGTLEYSYCGSYNRHIHAGCSTPGCVRWGE